MMQAEQDAAYLALLREPLGVCAHYLPRFGQGGRGAGMSLVQFEALYGADPFYHWIGLDNPLMYAAHKAGGGMTSVYRQLGIGCEMLFRRILQDALGLTAADVSWSYDLPAAEGKTRTLHLDARIPFNRITDAEARARCIDWAHASARTIGMDQRVIEGLQGVVFEVRQGYKSKDSKRQNADIANAAAAYVQGYMPCAIIFSTQIDADILLRYRAARWIVLTGRADVKDAAQSTWAFMRDVIGYDLAAFLERHSPELREQIDHVLRILLSPQEGAG